MMEDPDPGVRSRAAAEWLAWEDTVISQESRRPPLRADHLTRLAAGHLNPPSVAVTSRPGRPKARAPAAGCHAPGSPSAEALRPAAPS